MLIYNAKIINENHSFIGSVITEGDKITQIIEGKITEQELALHAEKINAEGLLLIPGAIDTHVHFREPGLTHKADMLTESHAAVAGGVTSYMEMPNTNPQATTIEALEEKYKLAAQKSLANYSFYIGATNSNLDELKKVNPQNVCGVKLFMGSSTGNMLVNEEEMLNRLFAEIPMIIAAHCEDEDTIKANMAHYKQLLGDDIPVKYHPAIRSAEACYKSTAKAVALAQKHHARLHVTHLSTKQELSLFDSKPLAEKRITAEACVHHLWFTDASYELNSNRIKCNPAIKTLADREALRQAINDNKIDTVATDHAPHLWDEKQGSCLKATSGLPLVEWSVPTMLEMVQKGIFTYEKVVEKMCHAPAELFRVNKRGYIRPNYYADLVLIDPNKPWTVTDQNSRTKCAWSPIANTKLTHQVVLTMVNGNVVFNNGTFNENQKGERLTFN